MSNAFSPCGSTYFAAASGTAGNVWVTSLQPVNTYKVTNNGTVPVHFRLNANTASSVTAVYPSAGSPQLGITVPAGADNFIVVPSALNGQAAPQPAGFNSNIQFSYITQGTTANVSILPVLAF
jgi:hypothetical protein